MTGRACASDSHEVSLGEEDPAHPEVRLSRWPWSERHGAEPVRDGGGFAHAAEQVGVFCFCLAVLWSWQYLSTKTRKS